MVYILTVLEKTAHKWDNNKGEGDFVGEYDLSIKSAPFKDLTADNIINAIRNAITVDDELTFDDLYADDESGIISFNQIENADGLPDSNGGYIVDYTCEIERFELVNLSKIAQN